MVAGQIVSILGSAVLKFALNLYVLDLTGRADIFATVLAISFIPYGVFSPLGGAIADRFNRRNLMVIFDFCNSAVVLMLILRFLIKGDSSVVFITIILTLLSAIGAMYQPAVQASIPLLVKEKGLEQANGIVSGIGALSAMLGPVLGGILYVVMDLNHLLVISCIAFALSAVMEMFIHIPFTKLEQTASMLVTIIGDLKTGVRYMVKESPTTWKISAIAAGLNLFLSAFLIVGAPYILRVVMDSSDTMYAVGMALVEAAAIIGALTVGLTTKRMHPENIYKWIVLMGVLFLPMALAVTSGMLGLGYFPSFVLFFLFAIMIMILATAASIFAITQVQRYTPNALLGKIMAIVMAAAQCAAPLGQVFYGFILERFNDQIYIAVLIAAVMTVVVGFAGKKMKLSYEGMKAASKS
jgi:MFS family permease